MAFARAVLQGVGHFARRGHEVVEAPPVPLGDRLAVDPHHEVARLDRGGGGGRMGDHPGHLPVHALVGEAQAGTAQRRHRDRPAFLAEKCHLIVRLVERHGEILQHAAADRREAIGELGDRAVQGHVADVHRVGQPGKGPRLVAGEGADHAARPRRHGVMRCESDRVEAQRAVAAGIDEDERGGVAHADRDRGDLAEIVERDRGAGPFVGGGQGGEAHLRGRIVEGEHGLAEERKAEDAVDLDPEGERDGFAVEDQRRDVVEAGVAQLDPLDRRGGEGAGGTAGVAARDDDIRGGGRLGGDFAVALGEVGRNERGRGPGVDQEAIWPGAVPFRLDEQEVPVPLGGQDDQRLGELGEAGPGDGGPDAGAARRQPEGGGQQPDSGSAQGGGHFTGLGKAAQRKRAARDIAAPATNTLVPPRHQKRTPAQTGVMARESEPRDRKMPSTRPCSAGPAYREISPEVAGLTRPEPVASTAMPA